MNYSLFIDTSLNGLSLALNQSEVAGGKIVWKFQRLERFGFFNLMSEQLNAALEQLGAGPEHVTEVVVAEGPGSFTGIRIGLAWAYGFAAPQAAKTRMIGISALSAVAQSLGRDLGGNSSLAVALPSTEDHGFICRFESGTLTTDYVEVTFAKEMLGKTPLVFICDKWQRLQSELEGSIEVRNLVGTEVLDAALSGMLHEFYIQRQVPLPTPFPHAKYMRLSSAEERTKTARGVHGT